MATKTDKHLLSWGLTQGEHINIDSDLSGAGYSETLKFSYCVDTHIHGNNKNIFSGSEDCLDIVRGRNYVIDNVVFHCSGLQGATIKGSTDTVIFNDCTFIGKPKNGYVVLGQYCDYDIINQPKTKNIKFINCAFEDPKVGIRLWNAEKVQFQGQSCKVNKTWPIIVKCYFLFRKIQDRLKYGKYGRGGKEKLFAKRS